MSRKRTEFPRLSRVDVALAIGAVAVIWLLCQPEGPVGREWKQWRASGVKAAAVRSHWNSLVSGSTFLGDSESEATVVVFLD